MTTFTYEILTSPKPGFRILNAKGEIVWQGRSRTAANAKHDAERTIRSFGATQVHFADAFKRPL